VGGSPPHLFKKTTNTMDDSKTPSIPNPYDAMIAVLLDEVQKRLDKAVDEIKESVKAMNTADEHHAISVNEAAKLLGIHRNTVVSLVKREDLAAQMIGTKYLIPRKSISDYLAQNRPEAAPALRGTK
jgi:excisionase family DNA binding protein